MLFEYTSAVITIKYIFIAVRFNNKHNKYNNNVRIIDHKMCIEKLFFYINHSYRIVYGDYNIP